MAESAVRGWPRVRFHGCVVALGWSLLIVVAAGSCTAKPAPRREPTAPSTRSPTNANSPRSCSSLVGRPFYSAMSGGGVTCSLGIGTTGAAIRVIARTCPDAAPFYEFYSTDPSNRADRSTYFGSQVSPLYQTNDRSITVHDMQVKSCP